MYPHLIQFEENRLEIERERQLRREIRAAREEVKARRKAASTPLLARIRTALRRGPAPCPAPCPDPA
jgi:hypothetical protein